MPGLLRLLAYAWAAPNTALGVLIVIADRMCGGQATVVGGVLEAHGPLARGVLTRLPFVPGGAMALTLGHVVIGTSASALEVTRAHERVHVAQYERWGPFFLPAYAVSSAGCMVRGKDPYRENRFEREAYGVGDEG